MKLSRIGIVAASVALLFTFNTGCSDPASPAGTADGNTVLLDVPQGLDADPGDLPPDDTDVVEPEYESCDENEDCESLLCILTQEGSVCTEPCVSECPKGFKCAAATTGGPDPLFVCLPSYLTLCFPCNEDKDCATVPGSSVVYENIQCISQGGAGSFCGGACESGEDCPDDFDCQEVDGPVKQCVPVSGECGCSSLAESLGVTSECYFEDELGNRCTGDIQCSEGVLTACSAATPAAESCDGEDNDCDGNIDNDLTAPAGDLQGGVCLGSEKECGGAEGWQEPNYTLIAGYEAVEETCDGKDNDCEGTVDNELVPPPADIQLGECVGAVKICLGASGWAEPNYGAVPTYETTETLCDGLDNDCDGEVDEVDDFAPLADNQLGVCVGAVKVCAGTEGWVEPDYSAMDGYEADETLCDEKDNDCDDAVDEEYLPGGGTVYTDTDGSALAKSEACGVGGCDGGTVVCGDDQLTLTCSTLQNAVADTCDGFDNDCDPATPDGTDDLNLGLECDGDDSDLCKESTITCAGGILTCVDTDDDDMDVCDGEDNDCNPATADGFGDPQLNVSCDGDGDDDLCKEGNLKCVGGSLACDDNNDPDPDFCDGLDNDCNPETLDGSADPSVGNECDGEDSDLCKEGTTICSAGQVICPDTDDDDIDNCDGLDNDCNPVTPDGFGDPSIDAACDGQDADMCEEGVWVCTGGVLSCNDENDVDVDVCDGSDNDCNGQVDDNLGSTTCGLAGCAHTIENCVAGVPQACDPFEGATDETCDGVDNDCDGTVDEGFANTDGDGQADCMDPDDDNDTVLDGNDNCSLVGNTDQKNFDGDALGDACDNDDDNDADPDSTDCEPFNDAIHSAASETCDDVDNNCNSKVDEGFTNTDGDGQADCVDPDDDNDTVLDGNDNCPLAGNTEQKNFDGDVSGDACDNDDDNDADPDSTDCEPFNKAIHSAASETCDDVDNNCNSKVDEGFTNTDGDGQANCVDPDDDNDTLPDGSDNCSLISNPLQEDLDKDNIGDACDNNIDGDPVDNAQDCEPLNPDAYPGATELCNEVDDNCDNVIDEGFQCTPGDTESAACGNCGTKTRTCSGACMWDSYGACSSQGVCTPGQVTSSGCGTCQQRTCQSNCSYGGCTSKPSGTVCGQGQICHSGQCCYSNQSWLGKWTTQNGYVCNSNENQNGFGMNCTSVDSSYSGAVHCKLDIANCNHTYTRTGCNTWHYNYDCDGGQAWGPATRVGFNLVKVSGNNNSGQCFYHELAR